MCLNETTPQGEAGNFVPKKRNFNESATGTMLEVQDWGVILFFETYLKEWDVIIKSLNKKDSCKWIARNTKAKKPKTKKTKEKTHNLILNRQFLLTRY